MQNKTCPLCGEDIPENTGVGARRKWCSSKCRIKMRQMRSKKRRAEKMMRKNMWLQQSKTKSKKISDSCTGFKTCSRCGIEKRISKYHKHPCASDGISPHCKSCDSKKHMKYYFDPDRHDNIIEKRRAVRATEEWKRYSREYRIRTAGRRRELEREKRRTDPHYAIKCRMRSLVYDSLRGDKDSTRWQDLTGYSVEDLKKHLQRRFTKGMSWERFLNGDIHIDHKIPIAAFNFTTTRDFDFKRCWAISNLQPLWASDNIRKGDNLAKPFQPALELRTQ
jgi:hypothetical protein